MKEKNITFPAILPIICCRRQRKALRFSITSIKKSWIYWLKSYPITRGKMTMADLLFWLFMLLVSWILHLSD